MPDGKTHALATLATAGALTIAAPLLARSLHLDAWDSLGAPLGALAGLAISPDLDLAENRRVGAWAFLWLPYGKLAAHRGLSHFPVMGTALRIAYLVLVFALLGFLLHLDVPGWLGWIWAWHAVRWAVAGLAVADLVHIAMDAVTELLRPVTRVLE